MKRREVITGACALGAIALLPAAAPGAKPFTSNRISVLTRGNGPDVILIPGLTASRGVWNALVAALPGYRFHLVQVAGFAGTKAGGNATGPVLQPLAAEIRRYITSTGLAAPAVIGHSMGGTLAMILAARHPQQVGRVMVVDMLPYPAGLIGSTASGIQPLADTLRDLFTTTPGGRRLLGSLLDNYGGDDPKAPKSDPDLVGRAAHELATLDLTPELPKIRAPMTVVFATPAPAAADPRVIEADYKAAYSAARGAVLRPISNSGHMIMYDQPARLQTEVAAFLK